MAAVIGSLAPDLDAAQSKLKHVRIAGIKPLLLPAVLIHQTFGHRGALHSLLGLVALSLLTLPLTGPPGPPVVTAFALGFLSHLLLDGCTRTGVPLFWPRRRNVHLLPTALRVTTGSLAEEAVFGVLSALALLLLLRLLVPGGQW